MSWDKEEQVGASIWVGNIFFPEGHNDLDNVSEKPQIGLLIIENLDAFKLAFVVRAQLSASTVFKNFTIRGRLV